MSSDAINITGELIHIGQTQQVKDTFQKRSFVVKTHSEYPQELECQFTQDKCKELDRFKVGDTVTARVNLRGRGYQKREGGMGWFTSLDCWKLDKLGEGAPANKATVIAEPTDLPF